MLIDKKLTALTERMYQSVHINNPKNLKVGFGICSKTSDYTTFNFKIIFNMVFIKFDFGQNL